MIHPLKTHISGPRFGQNSRASVVPLPVFQDTKVCYCFNLTADALTKIADAHQPKTLEALSDLSGAGTGCRACLMTRLKEFFDAWQKPKATDP